MGELPLSLQGKLLRFLQTQTFYAIGSTRETGVDVRVISATNRNLKKDVEEGSFRDDLYYRLSTLSIHIEPLRNRPEDIPIVIDYYAHKYSRELNISESEPLSPAAVAKLSDYPWPGNVRELQNVLQRIIVLGESEETIDGMLVSAPGVRSTAPHFAGIGTPGLMGQMIKNNGGELDLNDLSLKKIRKKAMNQVERQLISHVLIKTGWNRSKASRILKISYKTSLQKIEELDLGKYSNLN